MSTTNPIPIIIIGKSAQVGQGIIMALKPDYEVIHFLQSAHRSVSELPHLLSGSAPPPRTTSEDGESNLGTQNYASRAQAIVIGGGSSDEDIERMRDACKGFDYGVPWFRPDLTKEMPPVGTREYGMRMVQRAREALERAREEGKWERDGVYWY